MKDERMDPRQDAEFDALMRDAAHTWRRPPRMADADASWRAIEQALDRATPVAGDAGGMPSVPMRLEEADAPHRAPARAASTRRWVRPWTQPLARMAAMLLVGVAVGRVTVRHDAPATSVGAAQVASAASGVTGATAITASDAAPTPERVATDRYLVRTAALLAGLPDELHARRGDAAFRSQADALLLQTRLLLDSPAAADPALRALLDDLEVVLAQVVRLDSRRDPVEVDFLHQALEQRDVLPRLREAVADNAAE